MSHSEQPESEPVAKELEEQFYNECCLTYDQLASLCQFQQTGEPVVHLNTYGRNNVLSSQPRVYKHQLLKNHEFRARVIEYYKALGYIWIDLVVLNRRNWKIFLFQEEEP